MPRPRSDIRSRILSAARKNFLQHGVTGASLRSIARGARTNIGMIYYYFKTKDDLFLAVVEEPYENVIADMEAALRGEGSLEERLVKFSTRLGQLTDLELDTLKLVLHEALVSSARVPRLLERFQRGHLALVAAAIGEGRVSGQLRSELHPALMVMVTLAVSGAPQAMRRVTGENFPFSDVPEGDAMSRQLIDMLMRGLSSPTQKKEVDP
ncbi:MAG: TetR/AcrR family transcriptional regulator [Polyangiaceae bacterium]